MNTRFHSRNCSVLVAGLLLAFAASSRAELIEFTFEGTMLTVVNPSAPFGSIIPGDSYALSYVFDSAAIDSSMDPAFGTYLGAIQSFDLTIGGMSFSGAITGGGIQVNDATFPDAETYEAAIETNDFGFRIFAELPPDTLTSTALPTSFAESDFMGTFVFEILGAEDITGDFDKFTSQVVPLPGSVLLGMAGFGMVGWVRRRNAA